MGRKTYLGLVLLALGVVRAAPVPEKVVKPVDALLLEVTLPPPGVYEKGKEKPFQPVLGKTPLGKYADRGQPQKKLRQTLRNAQVLLWATSPAATPRAFTAPVAEMRKQFRGTLVLPEVIRIPANAAGEARLREQLFGSCKQIARVVSKLEQMVEDLDEIRADRDRENVRWQANHDLTRAWLQQRITYFEEHALTLGMMRKELPPHHPGMHSAWRLVGIERTRDFAARKRSREAEKLLKEIVEQHPDTVWAELAHQAQKAHLSVEWQAVK